METWKKLEFEYAARLRSADSNVRKTLYGEAYSQVAMHRVFKSNAPEDRTAGTSDFLIGQLRSFIKPTDSVLEIGCGRGYTCMKLAAHVNHIVGTEVSEPSILEAQALLREKNIKNALIQHVSAIDLASEFVNRKFDVALSIEVVEHLHPDDAEEHVAQIFSLLNPGGKYIITMPNRLNGPHDITREEFPSEKRALGFHLNESTYGEMIALMRAVGFTSFWSFQSFRSIGIQCLKLRASRNEAFEKIFRKTGARLAEKFLPIQLIAAK